MKNKLTVLSIALALFLPLAARAELHQVTALNATATKQIIIPGNKVLILTIQNIGANAVNMTIDGGSAAGGQDPGTGATGNGLVLAAGQSVTMYGPWLQGIIISGVTQASTTTLNVTTNAPAGNSTFNTN